MNPELEIFCNRLLSALLNGGYQGLLLTVAIACGLRFLPRVNATTRHMVWLATLLIVGLLPLMHFLSEDTSGLQSSTKTSPLGADQGLVLDEDPKSAGSTSTGIIETEGEAQLGEEVIMLIADAIRKSREQDMGQDSVEGNSFSRREIADAIQSLFPARARDYSRVSPPSQSEPLSTQPRAHLFPMGLSIRKMSLPGYVGVVLTGIWISLTLVRLGNLVAQCCWLRSLKRRAISAPEYLQTVFEALGEEMRVSRTTRLLTCDESPAPMAVGLGCPVVLLPSRLLVEAESIQLEQVLRHELAHVSRWDDWTNLLQQTIKAFLFFHPAVWWLSRRLTIEREIACDDHVLAAIEKPKTYALLLTEFASQGQSRDITAAPAAWGNNNHLKERITMILDPNRNSSPRLARTKTGLLTAAATLAAILILQTGPRLVLAEQEQSPSSSAASSVVKEAPENTERTTVVEANEAPTPKSATKARTKVISRSDEDSASAISIGESGPKIKSRASSDSFPTTSSPTPTPKPPTPPLTVHPSIELTSPVIAHLSTAISVPAAPSDGASPAPAPAAPSKARKSSDSIERRLERLEKMVESLMAREKGTKRSLDLQKDFNFNMKLPPLDLDKEKFAKLAEEHKKLIEKMQKFGPNNEEIARSKERAGREAEHAVREAEKVARDAERIARDAKRQAEESEKRALGAVSRSTEDSFDKQRQALEAHRNALKKEMEAIQRQLQQLQQEQQRIEPKRAPRERRPDRLDQDTELPKPAKPLEEDEPRIKR